MVEEQVAVPVYRDGTRLYYVAMNADVDERGEAFVTLADALRWEALHHRLAATITDSSRLPRTRRRLFGKASSGLPLGEVWTSATAPQRPAFA